MSQVDPQASLAERYSHLSLQGLQRPPSTAALRVLDVGIASLSLLVLAPVAGVIAVAIVTSGRPILYRGERVGRNGRVFTMRKFRTLRPGAESRLGQCVRRRARPADARRGDRGSAAGCARRSSTRCRSSGTCCAATCRSSGRGPIRPRFFEELVRGDPGVLAATRRAAGADRLRPDPDRPRGGVGARSSRTTSSGSPTARCASTCGSWPRPSGAWCASRLRRARPRRRAPRLTRVCGICGIVSTAGGVDRAGSRR